MRIVSLWETTNKDRQIKVDAPRSPSEFAAFTRVFGFAGPGGMFMGQQGQGQQTDAFHRAGCQFCSINVGRKAVHFVGWLVFSGRRMVGIYPARLRQF